MLLAVGNIGVGEKISIMIKKQIKFNFPFGPTKFIREEKSQTKGNSGAVQEKQLVFKSKFSISGSYHFTDLQRVIKMLSKHQ